MQRLTRYPVRRYGIALLAVVVPLLISTLLRRAGTPLNPTWLILAALVIAAWYGGRGPGLLAALLFALIINYFSSPPRFSLKYNFVEINRLGVLALLAWLTSARRRAEERLKDRARQQAAVAQLGQRALAGNDLSLLMDETASVVAQQLEVEYSSVLELLPDGQHLQSRAGVGWKEGYVGATVVGAGAGSQAGYTLLSSEPVVVANLRQETRFSPPAPLIEHGVVSGMSVIIPGQHRPFGVLGAHTTERRTFTQDDINFLQAVANVLAEAIERQRAEERVREQREWLGVTLSSIGDAVIATDTDGCVTFMNGVAQSLTGWEQEEAVKKSLEEVFRIVNEETSRPAENPVIRVIREGEVMGLANHTVLISRDGTERPIDDSGAPIKDAQGKIIGVVLVFHDISERRRAEKERAQILDRERAARAEAEEANRMKDEFLATVSHELRTPLTALLGWAQLLNQGLLDRASTAKALESIERNAKSQAQLVEDLLDVSRIITGKLHLRVRPVELLPMIEAALDAVRPAAAAKRLQLQVDLDPDAGQVSGDPNRLQQIISNLLSNAIKFTPEGGRVQVQLRRLDSAVEIKVSDTGQGIKPEFLPYIFDRFRQADASTTRAHGGLGLGLSIVRHLVDLHDGSIHAESPGEGQGATFTVRLPPSQLRNAEGGRRNETATAEPSAICHPPSAILDGLRVLAVEDEPDTLDLLTVILTQSGAAVTAASSAAEALAVLAHSRPDVLVSDIGLPDENGYSLIGKVRALTQNQGGAIPALALTAYARSEDRERALAAGYQVHLAKPIEPEELTTAVAKLAGRIGVGPEGALGKQP